MSFIEDNLLVANGNISHHGEVRGADEEMSPTLENLVVLTWLRLVHPDLLSLVKQRYGTELRSKSLASLKPEISQALDSLLEEINNNADAGEYLELDLPPSIDPDFTAIEVRTDVPSNKCAKVSQLWPRPQIVEAVASRV